MASLPTLDQEVDPSIKPQELQDNDNMYTDVLSCLGLQPINGPPRQNHNIPPPPTPSSASSTAMEYASIFLSQTGKVETPQPSAQTSTASWSLPLLPAVITQPSLNSTILSEETNCSLVCDCPNQECILKSVELRVIKDMAETLSTTCRQLQQRSESREGEIAKLQLELMSEKNQRVNEKLEYDKLKEKLENDKLKEKLAAEAKSKEAEVAIMVKLTEQVNDCHEKMMQFEKELETLKRGTGGEKKNSERAMVSEVRETVPSTMLVERQVDQITEIVITTASSRPRITMSTCSPETNVSSENSGEDQGWRNADQATSGSRPPSMVIETSPQFQQKCREIAGAGPSEPNLIPLPLRLRRGSRRQERKSKGPIVAVATLRTKGRKKKTLLSSSDDCDIKFEIPTTFIPAIKRLRRSSRQSKMPIRYIAATIKKAPRYHYFLRRAQIQCLN